MSFRKLMTVGERERIIQRLAEMDPELVRKLEEVVNPYRTTLARLRHAGIELEWPLKEIYPPIRHPKAGSS